MSAFSDFGRRSGILLHVTSLPGRFGIGDLGPQSRWFVDFLVETGQKVWCVLPLVPTGPQNSPYESLSAFAGNPLLISPELLVERGYLSHRDLNPVPGFSERSVQFASVRRYKLALLRKAYAGFSETKDFLRFQDENAWWLRPYAEFMSLHEAHAGAPWTRFDKTVRPPSESVRHHEFVQYEFFRQWTLLREYCHGRGISILGDVPFYIEHDSADVWACPRLFDLAKNGRSRTVGGVPPDYFSHDGQRWGTPTYNWKEMATTGYRWWIERLRFTFQMVDLLRLDHFRGFESFWSVKAGEPTACKGRWIKGPGAQFFGKMREELGDLPLIAENLGVITPKVESLRRQFDFPGMALLQFAFGEDDSHRPHKYVTNLVSFTGTHDNDTTVGWWRALRREARSNKTSRERAALNRVRSYLQISERGQEIHWMFIRAVMTSVAQLAIIPMQDVLGLPSRARMNQPGRVENNWKWRCQKKLLRPEIARRLGQLTIASGR